MLQVNGMRALLCADGVDARADSAKPLDTFHCMFHTVGVHVFKLVDLQSIICISSGEEDNRVLKPLPTGWIEIELSETIGCAVSHDGVGTDGLIDGPLRVCEVFHPGVHNLVTCDPHGLERARGVDSNQCCDVSGFRSLFPVVNHLDAVVRIWPNVRQVGELYTLVVLGAVIEDGEHVIV